MNIQLYSINSSSDFLMADVKLKKENVFLTTCVSEQFCSIEYKCIHKLMKGCHMLSLNDGLIQIYSTCSIT